MSWGDANVWAAVGQMLSAFFGLGALYLSISTYRKSLQFLHYGELDKMYFDILRLAVERPYLRTPEANTDSLRRVEYDSYAFMVWNFIETIYDRCAKHRHLECTWHPVVDAENRIHRRWFDLSDNAHKFKPEFRAFIRKEFPVVSAPSEMLTELLVDRQPAVVQA